MATSGSGGRQADRTDEVVVENRVNRSLFCDGPHMQAGFKYALIAKPDEYFTFQLKAYIPSGDAFKGLGTEHWTIEPGLLYYKQLTRKLTLEAEFRDWIPINGTNLPIAGVGDYTGSILRYGVGLGYTAYDGCNYRIAPVAELVGWSVLDGRALNNNAGVVENAAGDTIVNMKLGVRVSTGTRRLLPAGDTQSLYIGYGHALTGDRWYRDILRVEYRILF